MNWINRSRVIAINIAAITVACLLPRAYAGPSVTVVNTPSTIVANTASNAVPVVITGALSVGTSTNAPLLVRDVDNAARSNVQVFATINIADGSDSNDRVIYTVPARKILVIEFVSARAQVPTGQQIELAFFGPIELIPHLLGTFTGQDVFAASQQMRYYPAGALGLDFFFFRNSTVGAASVAMVLEGYLVDAQ